MPKATKQSRTCNDCGVDMSDWARTDPEDGVNLVWEIVTEGEYINQFVHLHWLCWRCQEDMEVL